MDFESLNTIDGGKGERKYIEAGSPTIPALLVDGRSFPVLHPVQMASVLDLPRPGGFPDTLRMAWDSVAILENWVEVLPKTSWELVLKPTPSRGRSIRNLTVNTFRPYGLLREAWRTGTFDWYTGEEDTKQETQIEDLEGLEAFARSVLRSWEEFVTTEADELAVEDPRIASNRGDAPFSTILGAQRWHAAFHHRQLLDFLRKEGIEPIGILDVEGFTDLELPESVY